MLGQLSEGQKHLTRGPGSSEDGWAVTKPLMTLPTRKRRGVDAGVLGGSRGMERRAGMSNEHVTSAETKGVAVEVLATIDLAGEVEGMQGHQLRMRMVTIEPGGVFGPIHDHKGRPGTVYILQGMITDHRNGVATEYGPGGGLA